MEKLIDSYIPTCYLQWHEIKLNNFKINRMNQGIIYYFQQIVLEFRLKLLTFEYFKWTTIFGFSSEMTNT